MKSGPTLDELDKQIYAQIKDHFKDFILSEQTNDFNNLKIMLIYGKINKLLTDKLRKSKTEKDRTIPIKDVIQTVQQMQFYFYK